MCSYGPTRGRGDPSPLHGRMIWTPLPLEGSIGGELHGNFNTKDSASYKGQSEMRERINADPLVLTPYTVCDIRTRHLYQPLSAQCVIRATADSAASLRYTPDKRHLLS